MSRGSYWNCVPILEVTDLGKTYRSRGKAVHAVNGVSLHVEATEILAFLGPNGAGKTTTIKMIAGLVEPDCGEVQVLGEDPHRHQAVLRNIGVVLEGNRNIYWRMTPEENLIYFGMLKGLSRSEARIRGAELIERFDLEHKRDSIVQKLSRGMQQKVALAVALVHRPKLLLLDEPTLGLDVEAAEEVKQLVRETAADGCAVLLTTHQLEVAEALSDRVAVIRGGNIVAQAPTCEILDRYASEAAYVIRVQGRLHEQRLATLASLGAQLRKDEIVYFGEPLGLYRVIEALKPLPIVSIDKDGADLTAVFLRLVREDIGV